MPDTIQFGNGRQIINSYDAGGHKLTIQYYTPIGTVIVTQGSIHGGYTTANSVLRLDDYCGSYLYENGTSASVHLLTKILTPEGYWQNGIYYYYLKDHQGNTRIVLNQNNVQVEISHYYPDGMRFESSKSNSAALPYRYNGKELESINDLNQYDYGARRRETGIPVWTAMDPLAEKYYSISPYAYVRNNPILLIDPDGMQIKIYQTINQIIIKEQNTSSTFSLLLTEAVVNTKNSSRTVSFGHNTYTNAQTGHISISKDMDTKKQIIKLTHELTNKIKKDELNKSGEKVSKGEISPTKYANELSNVEKKKRQTK